MHHVTLNRPGRGRIRLQPRRHLAIEGAYNIRDLGGYPTLDGRRTRWKTFIRASSLHRLPPDSQAALVDYGIRTVIDLRSTHEVDEAPSVFADQAQESHRGYYHQNLTGDEPLTNTSDSVETGEPSERILAVLQRVARIVSASDTQDAGHSSQSQRSARDVQLRWW